MRVRKNGAVPSAQERLRKNIRETVVMRTGQTPTYRIGSERDGEKNEALRVKHKTPYTLLTALDNVGSAMGTTR